MSSVLLLGLLASAPVPATTADAGTPAAKVAQAQVKDSPTPTSKQLVAALPPKARAFARTLQGLRVVSLELDGTPPAEAVLSGNSIEPANPEDEPKSPLWVFRRKGSGWRLVTTREWPIDRYWKGTYDGEPGFKVVRGAELLAPGQSLVRVEHQDMRGGADVRFISRSFELWRLDGDTLAPVFRCTIDSESASGPEREDAGNVHRVIDFVGDGWPRDIRVQQDGKEARYRFDGKRYVAEKDDLCLTGG
jgi:hypothetical protein